MQEKRVEPAYIVFIIAYSRAPARFFCRKSALIGCDSANHENEREMASH